jgi:hypothetical protein
LSSRTVRFALLGLPVAFVLSVCERASALPLISVSASLRGLYGSYTGEGELNPYGFGLGARAGVTLPASLYLGGSLDLFFGETIDGPGGDVSASIFQVMGNVGYDLSLGPLVLRPFLGAGLASVSGEICAGSLCASDSEGKFALAPGAEAYVGLGLLSLTGEVRYNKIFDDPEDGDALVLGVGLGLSF